MNYNIQNIFEMIPHRYPLLLIDKVESTTKTGLVAIKNVTINEQFFQGHFPGHPVMPGVLIIEAIAQAGAIYVVEKMRQSAPEEISNKLVYLMTIEEAKFRAPVVPGDVLRIEIEEMRMRGNICKLKGMAYVENKLVSECIYSAMITEKENYAEKK